MKLLVSKIIFIGLPGAGKSSAAFQLAKKHNLQLYSSDVEIKNILNAYKDQKLDINSIYYKKINELKIQFINNNFEAATVDNAFLSAGYEKHSLAFMNILNEFCWRETEAAIAALLIKEHPDCVFDLGASQVLNASVQKAINDNDFHLIYLDADAEAIEKHLLTPQSNGEPRWKLISNYAKAGNRWLELTQEHREIRAPQYARIADEVISVKKDTSIDNIIEEVEELVNSSTYQYRM